MKITTVLLFFIAITLFFTGCGEKVDDVINEMTLKGTIERGEKTKAVLGKVQKQYKESLKELQEFDNPTNSLKTDK